MSLLTAIRHLTQLRSVTHLWDAYELHLSRLWAASKSPVSRQASLGCIWVTCQPRISDMLMSQLSAVSCQLSGIIRMHMSSLSTRHLWHAYESDVICQASMRCLLVICELSAISGLHMRHLSVRHFWDAEESPVSQASLGCIWVTCQPGISGMHMSQLSSVRHLWNAYESSVCILFTCQAGISGLHMSQLSAVRHLRLMSHL